MSTQVGNTVTFTSSAGYTRSWRGYFNYTVTTSATAVKVTVTACGIEARHSGSAGFGAKGVKQTLVMHGDTKFSSATNSSSFTLQGVGDKKTINGTNYSISVARQSTAKTITVKLTTTSSSWNGGSSTATLSVSIPALETPTISSAVTKENGKVYMSYTIGGVKSGAKTTAEISVNATFEEGLLASHPNITASETDVFTATLTAPITYGFEIPCIENDEEVPYSDMYNYTFKTTAVLKVNGTTMATKTLTNTLASTAKQDASVSTIEVATTEELPVIRGDGKSEIDVIAYNFVTGEWDVIAKEAKTTITSNGFKFSVNIGRDYIEDPLAEESVARIKFEYDTSESSESKANTAFFETTRNTNYTNGMANLVFIGGCVSPVYSSRVWYSYVNDPLYFPADNFIEVGSNDTAIMGLIKIGEYLGIVKQGKTTDTSIFVAYPISFDDDTAYAVKPAVNGVGASAKYSFNILGNETLFLSNEGVMAVSFSETDIDKQVKNRSFFVDGKLLDEPNLENAYSFVWKGFYLLAVNNHVYLLDGNQRNSWGNDKTNLVYEGYFWDNVPAKCFVKFREQLWFSDGKRICRFKTEDDESPYNDNGEAISAEWSTILDDDGSVNFTKNLQKKGCVVSILPEGETSAEVYIKKDSGEPELIVKTDIEDEDIPSEIIVNKKIKKYKRLQFIVRNNELDQPFGINKIVKVFNIGNYTKK